MDLVAKTTVENVLSTVYQFSSKLENSDVGNHLMHYVIVLLGLTMYWYFFKKPFNLFKDFTDIGYEHLSSIKSNTVKMNEINEIRKRRKIGDNLPPVYPNGWFAICESSQLAVRTAKEIYVAGKDLVVWRGDSGTAYVADAFCPHLGAHLGVNGTVSGECIECPFHSWAFEGCTGKLVNIPYADSAPNFAKLNMWPTQEENGFIHVWYHAENESPSWWVDRVPQIHSGAWKYRGRSEFRISCHIQEIPENGADVAHLNVLHKSAIMCGGHPENSSFSWNFIQHHWRASWAPNEDSERKHEALLTVNHWISLFGKYNFFHIHVDCHQVGPGIVMLYFDTFFGKGILIQTVTPIGKMMQKVVHQFYSSNTFIHPLGTLILAGEATQIERDIRIWNRKVFLSKPLLTSEDKLIKSFRKWYSQFYTENSPKYEFTGVDSNANNLEF